MIDSWLAELEERFLRYVRIYTESDEASPTIPSTERQYDLLNLLAAELREIGAEDVVVTDYATCLATIPATVEGVDTIGFCSHVDTTADFSGENIKPLVHRNYDGAPIVLPDAPERVIDPAVFPYLAGKKGEDVVTASGTTLLGADDKAGIAVIMVMAHHLLTHPEIPHGDIRIAFTPDEEIGRGVHPDLAKEWGAVAGYTLDGGPVGEIEYETFSAEKATITISGVSIHPGTSYGKMVNSVMLAGKLLEKLPQDRLTPATTKEKEGFIHCYKMEGSTAETVLHLILRDFELDGLQSHIDLVQHLCDELQAEEPRATVSVEFKKQYRNMRYWLEKDMRSAEYATASIKACGITPISKGVRGGTDGSRLTEQGIPTPNLFTGCQNAHGPLEYVSLQDMAKAVEVCVDLVQRWVA